MSLAVSHPIPKEEPVADYVAYFGGQWLPFSEVRIDPMDRGFLGCQARVRGEAMQSGVRRVGPARAIHPKSTELPDSPRSWPAAGVASAYSYLIPVAAPSSSPVSTW
jgi:hypothetical protein